MTAESFLDAVDAMDAAATPGPWEAHAPWSSPGHYVTSRDRNITGNLNTQDAAFIAAARSDLPRLAAFARAVLALCERAEKSSRLPRYTYLTTREVRAALAEHLGEDVTVTDSLTWWGPPCSHEWRECHKHRDSNHEECDICGALRYEGGRGSR